MQPHSQVFVTGAAWFARPRVTDELLQRVRFGHRIGQIPSFSRYFKEASFNNFTGTIKYALGTLKSSVQFRLQKMGLAKFRIFE